MNLMKEFNKKQLRLLHDAGVKIEDKEYSAEDLQRCEDNIVGFIMNHSCKNGDIDKLHTEYAGVLRTITSQN